MFKWSKHIWTNSSGSTMNLHFAVTCSRVRLPLKNIGFKLRRWLHAILSFCLIWKRQTNCSAQNSKSYARAKLTIAKMQDPNHRLANWHSFVKMASGLLAHRHVAWRSQSRWNTSCALQQYSIEKNGEFPTGLRGKTQMIRQRMVIKRFSSPTKTTREKSFASCHTVA